MKNQISKQEEDTDEMLPEYDFSKGTRGKHYRAYQEGYSVTIHQPDGSSTVQYFKPDKGVVTLEPDVQVYFPDSETVNKALHGLIALIPQEHTLSKA